MTDTVMHLFLPQARLDGITREGDTRIVLEFSRVHLVQEMEGAFEDSLWTQAVRLTLQDVSVEGALPDCPCELQGGELTNNIYTWRNQVPLPIRWRGDVACKLVVAGTTGSCVIRAGQMGLEQIDFPRYVRHISKSWAGET